MVREALREQLRRHRPEQFRAASLLASADAEARKQFIPALRHAVEAEDYLRASDVVLHGGFGVACALGARRRSCRTFRCGTSRGSPSWRSSSVWRPTRAANGCAHSSCSPWHLAASRAWRRSQRPAERAGLALIETVVLRITGRAGDSVAPARRMMAILERSAPAELEEIADQVGDYWFQGALSLFRGGRLSEARVAAERVGISESALATGSLETIGAASPRRHDRLQSSVSAVPAAIVLARLDAATTARRGAGRLRRIHRPSRSRHPGVRVRVISRRAKQQLEDLGARPNLEYRPLFTAPPGLRRPLGRENPELGLEVLDQRESIDRPRARITAQDRQITAAARVMLHAGLGQRSRPRTPRSGPRPTTPADGDSA